MSGKKVKIRSINRTNFKRFGWLIDYPRKTAPKNINLFRIIVKQQRSGWRIAYLVVRDRVLTRLEQHPDSLESFEPVSGRGLLYVSAGKAPNAIKCFLLNKPVILRKGIWHGVVTLSEEFDVKIVENSKVRCVYRPLRGAA